MGSWGGGVVASWGCGVVRAWGCGVVGLWGCGVVGLWGCGGSAARAKGLRAEVACVCVGGGFKGGA